jgi:hydrogenase maturation protease
MSNEELKDLLIIGIGNSGRSDDGLGWLMLDALKKQFDHVDFHYRYQLQIEDAELLSHYPTVIFVDATKEPLKNGFFFKSCCPNNGFGITSHMLDPETILWLENQLYETKPATFVLGIEGTKWGLSLEPSEIGLSNLNTAIDFLVKNMNLIATNKPPCISQKSKTDENHML